MPSLLCNYCFYRHSHKLLWLKVASTNNDPYVIAGCVMCVIFMMCVCVCVCDMCDFYKQSLITV